MRRQIHAGGRPSKGDRHLFTLPRMSAAATDAVLSEAAARGLSHSEYLAVIVARAHGFDTPWPAKTSLLLSTPRTHRDHPRLATRVPRAAADRVMEEAEARDMPYNHYLATIVAGANGFDLPLPQRVAQHEEAFSIGA